MLVNTLDQDEYASHVTASPDVLYRLLPSVDEVLRRSALAELAEEYGQDITVAAVRRVLGRMRREIAEGKHTERSLLAALSALAIPAASEIEGSLRPTLVPVLNGTGVVLHTNLGRAPLSKPALEEIVRVAGGYSNLEFDLVNGERGRRDQHAEPMLLRALVAITGTALEQLEDEWSVAVVNNCAAATFLALNSIAEGGEVLVSRGELVEIGGGFRIPEILKKAGVILREVGTTNRTRISDYAEAMTPNTRMILRVHQSNFRIEGFTEKATLRQLVALGEEAGVPVFEDQGTGLLIPLDELGVREESSLLKSICDRPGLIAASGDKLIGGPQCGILLGRRKLMGLVRANPLFRALRVDKLTYAALEATLRSYATRKEDEIPAIRMLRTPVEAIRVRCQAVVDALAREGIAASSVAVQSVIGGGTTAGATLSSFAVELCAEFCSASEMLDALRRQNTPVIARVQQERILLDLRTILPDQDEVLTEMICAAVEGLRG